jgi:hypothetical protein
MSLSEVGICNLALGWLGANLITSLDDDSEEARLCDANYEAARDATLEDRNWVFATTRRTLTPLAAAPDFGYSNAFQLPSDCIRVVQADSDEDQTVGEMWERNEDTLLADAEVLYIRYIKRITDTVKFSAGFVQACAAQIGVNIAIAITGSKDMQTLMEAMYEDKVGRAGTMDGLQGKNKELRSTKLTKVR